MDKLTLNMDYTQQFTNISNIFIEQYMPLANGEFVKVYIYLLKCAADKNTELSISGLADIFNQTEADIVRALRYWDKVGAIVLHTTPSSEHSVCDITFCDINSTKTLNNQKDNVPSNVLSRPARDNTVDFATAASNKISYINVETRTAYTPKQMKEFYAQDDFSMLLYAVGTYLGGTLNSSDASTIAYFYDTLHFPSDLIEYLIGYCVSNEHRSMRYIEKVALTWAEKGVSSVKQAKTLINNHNETIYSVLDAFGIKNRAAGKVEQDYIKKWTDVYCFSSDLIVEACNRTLRLTHEPSFEYTDTILTKWHNANVKTQEDIDLLDKKFEQTQQNKDYKKKNNAVKSCVTNKFNNFHQRNTDIDSLESSLLSNNG